MRIVVVALVALGLACSGCGSRTTLTTVPFAEARTEGEALSGRLVLEDGRRLRAGDAHLLGDWVCTGAGRGDVCIGAADVVALEREERRAGAGAWLGKGVALIAMWPAIAIWMHSEDRSDRESRAAARGEVLPPPRTAESARRTSIFFSLANCHHLRDRESTDGETLANRVWRERGACLDEAVAWFRQSGETDKARRLQLMAYARRRAEAMVCWSDPGLRAPDPDLIGGAGRTWMDEYRAVVADPRTYDYEARRSCDAPQAQAEPWVEGVDPVLAARDRARAGFPLTDPERLTAAIDLQARLG